MRNSKTKQINQRLSCTAFELTVGDVLSLFFLMGDFEYPTQLNDFALANKDDLLLKAKNWLVFNKPTDLLSLSMEDFNAVVSFFFDVNAPFFKGDESVSEFGERLFTDTQTGSEIYNQLSGTVASVTKLGYADALGYPFSYFLNVLDTLEANHGK